MNDKTPPDRPSVVHVHDEIVCDAPVGSGSVAEIEALMGDLPTGAREWPVIAQGGYRDRPKGGRPMTDKTPHASESHRACMELTRVALNLADYLSDDPTLSGVQRSAAALRESAEQARAALAAALRGGAS